MQIMRMGFILSLGLMGVLMGCAVQTEPLSTTISALTSAPLKVAADTYVSAKAPHKNHGRRAYLKLSSSRNSRVFLRFGIHALRQVLTGKRLQTAKLTLHIRKSAVFLGRYKPTLTLHRMKRPWTEYGATYHCANDRIPTNHKPDCKHASWKLHGPKAPWRTKPTATLTLTTKAPKKLTFDVTSDVQAFRRGSPNYGWVLLLQASKKSPHKEHHQKESTIWFGSRESLLPPSLTLETPGPYLPQCAGKCAGSDGCGGLCPDTCSGKERCGGAGTPNVCGCKPRCNRACGGDDGCGGSCTSRAIQITADSWVHRSKPNRAYGHQKELELEEWDKDRTTAPLLKPVAVVAHPMSADAHLNAPENAVAPTDAVAPVWTTVSLLKLAEEAAHPMSAVSSFSLQPSLRPSSPTSIINLLSCTLAQTPFKPVSQPAPLSQRAWLCSGARCCNAMDKCSQGSRSACSNTKSLARLSPALMASLISQSMAAQPSQCDTKRPDTWRFSERSRYPGKITRWSMMW